MARIDILPNRVTCIFQQDTWGNWYRCEHRSNSILDMLVALGEWEYTDNIKTHWKQGRRLRVYVAGQYISVAPAYPIMRYYPIRFTLQEREEELHDLRAKLKLARQTLGRVHRAIDSTWDFWDNEIDAQYDNL